MTKRPNILFVMTDHTSSLATRPASGCLTPNIDKLAREGLRLHRAYTINSICSPSRASLMTGQYASTHGVWDCTHTQRPEWVNLHGPVTTWAQRLVEAGYTNGYYGKWHVEQSGQLEKFGFPTYDVKCAGAGRSGKSTPKVVVRNPGYKDAYMAGVIPATDQPPRHPAFDRGIEFIRQHARDAGPFCCFVSTIEPHDPYVAPQEFWNLYDPAKIALSPSLHDDLRDKPEVIRRMRSVWKNLDETDWRSIVRAYYAMVTFLDHELGRIVQTLRDEGLYDNTIIVFTSDHGDMLGAQGLVAKGITPYEPVYNIPMIVRAPLMRTGEDTTHVASIVDLAPTLVDLCGAAPLERCQGRSLRPVLDGTAVADDWQDAYAEFYGQRFVYTQRITWHGHWKYVFSPGGIDELYDLAADPHERHNLAADPAHQDRLNEMTQRMWRKMKQIGDTSLLSSHYSTLRTAPIGPLSIEE